MSLVLFLLAFVIMKKSFLLTIVFTVLVQFVISQKNILSHANFPNTCSASEMDVATDTASFSFPMVLVGNISTAPDSVNLQLNDTTKRGILLSPGTLPNSEMINFFIQNIVYPKQLIKNDVEDVIDLQLKLDANGNLCNLIILSGNVQEMREEVIRVAKKLPRLQLIRKKKLPSTTLVSITISFKILKL